MLWFALARDGSSDWKCITTASAWRQLSKYLWPEVSKWAGRLRWDVIGRGPFNPRTELMALSLRLETGAAFAVASDSHELIEGAHADSLLTSSTRPRLIPASTWDAAEGALSGQGEAFALAICTPGEPAGRFHEIHRRAQGLEDWSVRHVTLEDALQAGRVSSEWAEQRKRQWGETSAVYQNRVLGEFCASDADGLVPLAWAEAAVERWEDWDAAEPPGRLRRRRCGRRPLRARRDRACAALRVDDRRAAALRQGLHDGDGRRRGPGAGRAQGARCRRCRRLGAGVVDRLRELGHRAIAFNASEGTDERDRSGELRFLNMRALAWWRLREAARPGLRPDARPAARRRAHRRHHDATLAGRQRGQDPGREQRRDQEAARTIDRRGRRRRADPDPSSERQPCGLYRSAAAREEIDGMEQGAQTPMVTARQRRAERISAMFGETSVERRKLRLIPENYEEMAGSRHTYGARRGGVTWRWRPSSGMTASSSRGRWCSDRRGGRSSSPTRATR